MRSEREKSEPGVVLLHYSQHDPRITRLLVDWSQGFAGNMGDDIYALQPESDLQRPFQFQATPKYLIGIGRNLDIEIDIPTLGLIVDPGTKEPNLGLLTKALGSLPPDGVDLTMGEAHVGYIPDGPRFSVFQLPTIWKFSVNKERN